MLRLATRNKWIETGARKAITKLSAEVISPQCGPSIQANPAPPQRPIRIVLPALLLFALSALLTVSPHASVADESAAGKNRPIISVTLPPLAGLIRMLNVDAEIITLLPANADPHHFQLTPRQVEMVRASPLLIRASHDDANWPSLPARATVDLWPDTSHAWLSPQAVLSILPTLTTELAARFPQQADTINRSLPAALASARRISQTWRKRLAPFREYGIIMQHPSWRGLCEEMGVPILAVLESPQHGHENSPRKLEKALDTLRTHPKALLLGDTRHSNRSLQWLADHAPDKKHLLLLDGLGNHNQRWDEFMQANLDRVSSK